MFFSRAKAAVAEKMRDLFPGGASGSLLERAEKALAKGHKFKAGDKVILGTGPRALEVSRLALGTGSGGWAGSSNQTRKLGIAGVSDMFVQAFETHGINFWDTADQYGSHPHIGAALQRVDREKVVVLTKTVAESPEAMRRDLDRFRRELRTDTIDVLLLHCMTAPDWRKQMRPVMDVISEAQEAGIVRMKGVSCHSFSALKAAVEEPWVELDLARINPGGISMDAKPDPVVDVLDQMKKAGKVVMGMKIFGNGRLSDKKEACLRFALGLSCVDCFTMGFESRDELEDVVGLIEAV